MRHQVLVLQCHHLVTGTVDGSDVRHEPGLADERPRNRSSRRWQPFPERQLRFSEASQGRHRVLLANSIRRQEPNHGHAPEFEDDELFIKLDESAERGVALDKGEPGRAVSVELEISKGTQNRKGEDNVDTFVLNQDGLTLSSVNDKYRTPLLSVGENGEFVAADGIGEKREKRARAVLDLIGLRFERGDDN